MKYILKLIRWKNLLIVALSMYAVWFFVNRRFFDIEPLQLNGFYLFLLIVSTVLIAAGGYIINDYFDVKIDVINHPESLIVSNKISRRLALYLHNSFNFIGLGLTAWIAYRFQNYWLVCIPFLSITLLWFYSTHFKRMPIIGNVVVAFLTGLSTFQLFLFEPRLYEYATLSWQVVSGKNNPVYLITGISAMAFLLNWMREIVKDMEDLKGDAEQGCRTLPILYGLKTASNMVRGIGWFTVALLGFAVYYFFVNVRYLDAILVLLLPILGILIVNFTLPTQNTKAHYGKLSSLLKWIMVAGLVLLFFLGK